MARKKPAKKATKRSARKPAARKMAPVRQGQGRSAQRRGTKKTAKKTPKKAAKKAAKKPAASARTARPAVKARTPARKARPAAAPARKAPAAKARPKAGLMTKVASAAKAAVSALAPKKKPNLDRPRKTVADVHGIPSSLDMDRAASAVKSGRAEMKDTRSKFTGSGPALTGGDVDADWQSAEAVGDEAPGGDNPTPDQDVVDEIGRSLGVEYADDEELQGGAEIADRDRNRWELDPSSKDDFEDED
jgi:hypothetical protein